MKFDIDIGPLSARLIVAAGFLLIGLVLAVAMPDCNYCGKGEVSFLQFWFSAVSLFATVAGIIFTCIFVSDALDTVARKR